jgi:hypothetical protein
MDSVAGAGADPQGGPVPAEQAKRGPQDRHEGNQA